MDSSSGADAAREPSAWRGLIMLLLVPLSILVLDNVIIPYAARIALRGRLQLASASVFNGIQDMSWRADGAQATTPLLRVKHAYVRLRFPWATPGHRARFVNVCVDGIVVTLPRPKASARPAPDPHAAEAAAHAAEDARLRRLMEDAASVPPASRAPPHAYARATEFAHAALRRVVHANTARAWDVLLHYIVPLLINFVSVEVRDVTVRVPHLRAAASVEQISLSGGIVLAYQPRATGARTTASNADGFGELCTGEEAAAPAQRARPQRLPRGHAHLRVVVAGVALRNTDTRARAPAAAALAGTSTVSVKARLGERAARESVQVAVQLASLVVDVNGMAALAAAGAAAGAPPAAAPPSPPPGTATPSPALPPASPPDPPPAAAALAALATFSASLPRADMHYAEGAHHVTVSVLHARLAAQTSDPDDSAHRTWFGACRSSHKPAAGGGTEAARAGALQEMRRVFYVTAHVDDVHARLADGERRVPLGQISDVQAWVRSSFTPFGVLPSLQYTGRVPSYFADDPNEAAAAVYVRVAAVRGAPDMPSLAALERMLSATRQRMQARQGGVSRAHASPARRRPTLPRLALVTHVDSVVAMVYEDARRQRALVLDLPRMFVSMQASHMEAPAGAPAHPLQYAADLTAGVDTVDVYLATDACAQPHAPAVTHESIVHMSGVEVGAAAHVPVSVDRLTWAPHVVLEHARTRLMLSVKTVEVDLWQAGVQAVLRRVAGGGGAEQGPGAGPERRDARGNRGDRGTGPPADAAPADLASAPPAARPQVTDGAPCMTEGAARGASPPAAAPPCVLSRLPSVSFLHVGVGSLALFVGGADPKYEPETRRGLAVFLGQTTADFARADASTRHVQLAASNDTRSALRLPKHIGTTATEIADEHGAGAAISLVQHELAVFPVVDLEALRGADGDGEGALEGKRGAGGEGAVEGKRGAGGEAAAGGESDTAGIPGPGSYPGEGTRGDAPPHGSDTDDTGVYTKNKWSFDDADALRRTHRHEPKLHQLGGDTYILRVPTLQTLVRVQPPRDEGTPQALIACRSSGTVSLRILLLHTYCMLVTVAALRALNKGAGTGRGEEAQGEESKKEAQGNEDGEGPKKEAQGNEHDEEPKNEADADPAGKHADAPNEETTRPPARPPPPVRLTARVPSFHLYASIPENRRVFLVAEDLAASWAPLSPGQARTQKEGTSEKDDPSADTAHLQRMAQENEAGLDSEEGAEARLYGDRGGGADSGAESPSHEGTSPRSPEGTPPRNPEGTPPRGNAEPSPSSPEEPPHDGPPSSPPVLPPPPHARPVMRFLISRLRGVVPSEERGHKGEWEEAVVARRIAVSVPTLAEDPPAVYVLADSIRLRIPDEYNVHELIEGSIVAFKASKQLFAQFVRGAEGSAIYPHAEEAKRLPIMLFRINMVSIEAADHAFDSRLNVILRAGSDEQLMRMERARLFAQRVNAEGGGDVPGAYARLLAYDASAWRRRIHNALAVRNAREEALLSYIEKHAVHVGDEEAMPVRMRAASVDPPLARMTLARLAVDVRRPFGFALDDTARFLHEAAGNPLDLTYTTVVAMHLRVRTGELVVRLRDYPLPLLHVPPMPAQAPHDDTIALEAGGDICIAEQLGPASSIRHVGTTVVPAVYGARGREHGLLVPKSVMSPQLYGTLHWQIRTPDTTIFSWGQSMQPAIQDLTRVVDRLVSPPHDPSPKPGPWDKIPLQMHARVHFAFAGPVHLYLKGSRDPYQVLYAGAGFVMAWQEQVEVRVGFANEEREFLQVLSGEHMLTIPDTSGLVDVAATGLDAVHFGARARAAAVLQRSDVWRTCPTRKVAWRLRGGVRWGLGLVPERTCTDATCERTPRCRGPPYGRQCRFSGRVPHWEVILRSREGRERYPEYAHTDSFAGWRSDFMHMSLSIKALGQLGYVHDGADADLRMSSVLNNMYISPLAWDHFWNWKNLFNSALSLPVRQGRLFPQTDAQQKPKFGKHLATIKYCVMISPMYISHVYRQRSLYDLAHGVRTFVGVKARLGVFLLDIHQRMQESPHQNPVDGAQIRAFHKPLYEAEVDLSDVRLMCIGARFDEQFGVSPGLCARGDATEDLYESLFAHAAPDGAAHPIFDADDYVELESVPVSDAPPRLCTGEALAFARFNFHRRLEPDSHFLARQEKGGAPPSGDALAGAPSDAPTDAPAPSKFGHEDTHTCLVGRSRVVMDMHLAAMRRRNAQLRADVDALDRELRTVHDAARREDLARHRHYLVIYAETIARHCATLDEQRTLKDVPGGVSQLGLDELHYALATGRPIDRSVLHAANAKLGREWEAFNNQILLYTPAGFIANVTRDLLYRYYTSHLLHRSFCQHLSVSEQRRIRDLLMRTAKAAEDKRADRADLQTVLEDLLDHTLSMAKEACGGLPAGVGPHGWRVREGGAEDDGGTGGWERDAAGPEDRAPADAREEHSADDTWGAPEPPRARASPSPAPTRSAPQARGSPGAQHSSPQPRALDPHPRDAISTEYELRQESICLCVGPQLVLHSDAEEHATVIVHAGRLRVRSYAVCDPHALYDPDSRTVLHRNYITLHALQCFHTERMPDADPLTGWGARSLRLPDALLADPGEARDGFARIMPETHAAVLYDKHNRLRLSDPTRPVLAADRAEDPAVDYLAGESDMIKVLAHRLTLVATTEQYAAIYMIVTDLLLRTDPVYKAHTKQLDALLYAYNFDDPSVVTGLVSRLQARIHDLLNMRSAFMLAFARLNTAGRAEFVRLNMELLAHYNELSLLEEATFLSHASSRDKEQQSATRLLAVARTIEWHMIECADAPERAPRPAPALAHSMLAKLVLHGVAFARVNLATGASTNSVVLRDLHAWNAHPEAYFEEIIAKYIPRAPMHSMVRDALFLSTAWLVLAPVGGIAIVDQFEFRLHPLRVQLELKIGRQLMDYWFGTRRAQARKERELDNGDGAPAGSRTKHWFRTLVRRHRRVQPADASEDSSDSDDDEPARAAAAAPSARAVVPQSPHAHAPRDTNEDVCSALAVEQVQEEMARRAARYASFVEVVVDRLVVCLSYKGDNENALTNLYDLVFQSPRLEYRDVLGSYGDLADLFRRDMIKIAWQNRNTLLKGVIAPNNKKRARLRRLRANRVKKYSDMSAGDVQHRLEALGESDSDSDTSVERPAGSPAAALPPPASSRTSQGADSAAHAPAPAAAPAPAPAAAPTPAPATARGDEGEHHHRSRLRRLVPGALRHLGHHHERPHG
ncbi:hypothetical protein MSPP1_003984 [Malassezia sp. CBS 17886]|nr:hypothetical protein MSPP1_003984 [Malassezia sp. CBS 17886]